MQLVHALAAGVRGAENGIALLYNRGGSAQIAYYLGDGGFEGAKQQTAGTPVQLDSRGGASVYVAQLALVRVYESDGTLVRSFTVGNYDANVEVISPSFTGTDYLSGASGVSKPSTLELILDAWITSAGAKDWKVLSDGSEATLQAIVSSLGGYIVSVKNYGAVGDGVADDTAAIGQAITAANTLGKVMFFPPGAYRVTSANSLLSQMNVLGCGPNRTSIVMDHASNSVFQFTGSINESHQEIRGISFGADQAHTGALFTITGDTKRRFVDCRFGDDNTVSASGTGYLDVDNNGISPDVELLDCHFYFPDGIAGQAFTDGASTATAIAKFHNCRFEFAGDTVATLGMIEATEIRLIGNTFDVGLVTSGGSNPTMVNLQASGLLEAVGNRISDTGGATVFFINTGANPTVNESANAIGSDCEFWSVVASTLVGSLGSRKGRHTSIAHASTATLDLDQAILENDSIRVDVGSGDNFSIEGNGALIEGLEFDLMVENSVGGASGTITWATNTFAGLTSVAGDVPPTSIAANGSFISVRWRCMTGPDGLRFYPMGQTLVAT